MREADRELVKAFLDWYEYYEKTEVELDAIVDDWIMLNKIKEDAENGGE